MVAISMTKQTDRGTVPSATNKDGGGRGISFGSSSQSRLADIIDQSPRMAAQRRFIAQLQHRMDPDKFDVNEGDGCLQNRIVNSNDQAALPHKSSTIQRATYIAYGPGHIFNYDNPPAPLPGAGMPFPARVGSDIHAELDLNDPVHGSGVGGANPERTDTATKYPATGWVMGHLLNSELGGVGKMTNLVPITNEANIEHAFAVERQVKKALYRQPATNIATANNGYVEYLIHITPTGGAFNSANPDLNINAQWRQQIQDPINVAPLAPYGWSPWTNVVVESRAGGALPTPAPWTAQGGGFRVIPNPVTEWLIAGGAAAWAMAPAGGLPALMNPAVQSVIIENAVTPAAHIIGYQF